MTDSRKERQVLLEKQQGVCPRCRRKFTAARPPTNRETEGVLLCSPCARGVRVLRVVRQGPA